MILDLNISNYEINTLKYNEIHNSNLKSPKLRLDFKSRQPKLPMSDPSTPADRAMHAWVYNYRLQ